LQSCVAVVGWNSGIHCFLRFADRQPAGTSRKTERKKPQMALQLVGGRIRTIICQKIHA